MPDWLSALLNHLYSEWRTLKGAPLAFLMVCALIGFAVWLALSWFYSGQLINKDSIIAARNAQIQEYLALSEEYREKLKETAKTLQPSAPKPLSANIRLSDLSNERLRVNALEFIKNLRTFEAKFQLLSQYQTFMEWEQEASISESTKSEKINKWRSDRMADEQRDARHKAEYEVRFRQSVLLYKTEICKREQFTNPCPTNSPAVTMINFPEGALFVGEIADYLTLITNNLPE